jgi:hypothetical protein
VVDVPGPTQTPRPSSPPCAPSAGRHRSVSSENITSPKDPQPHHQSSRWQQGPDVPALGRVMGARGATGPSVHERLWSHQSSRTAAEMIDCSTADTGVGTGRNLLAQPHEATQHPPVGCALLTELVLAPDPHPGECTDDELGDSLGGTDRSRAASASDRPREAARKFRCQNLARPTIDSKNWRPRART